MKPKIAIAGAGPAGTSLAIRLARQDFDVTLIERETFPRHKLCGEFISPECLSHFKDLGVLNDMLSAGGERIIETRFYEPGGRSFGVSSRSFNGDGFALSLSRSEMDMCMLDRAKSVGVKVFEGCTAVAVSVDKGQIKNLTARRNSGEKFVTSADLFVDATGRSCVLAKLAAKNEPSRVERTIAPKSLFVGFKSHLKGARVEKGSCEIYLFPGGYGGLSPVAIGLTNYCFLVKSGVARQFGGDADKIIRNVVSRNKRAAETLLRAETTIDWLAVSVDSFGRKSGNTASNLFSIGDSAAFIDPFTGSGMLIAFESAAMLAESIALYQYSLASIAEYYLEKYSQTFTRRLKICSFLRRAAFVPYLPTLAISLLNLSERGSGLLAASTRSGRSKWPKIR